MKLHIYFYFEFCNLCWGLEQLLTLDADNCFENKVTVQSHPMMQTIPNSSALDKRENHFQAFFTITSAVYVPKYVKETLDLYVKQLIILHLFRLN